MSQPTQPPPQQPVGANPYAQQAPQQPGYGYPQQAGYPQPGPPPQSGYAQQPGYPQNPGFAQVPGQPSAQPPLNGWVQPVPAQVPSRFGLGLLAGIGAALAAVFVYAAILRFTDHEIGYVALVVGLLVGGAAGKAGGRNAVLPVVAAVISLLAVWFGQLTGIAWMTTHHYPGISFFFDHFSDLVQSWKDHFIDARDILFFAIAGVEGFVVTRRMAQR
jgi:hypothetical protein